MVAHHHRRGQSVGRKRSIDIVRIPGGSGHQISNSHHRLDQLAREPLLNIFNDLALDGGIACRIELLGEKADEIAISSEVAICLDDLTGERVAYDLGGEVLELFLLTGSIGADGWNGAQSQVIDEPVD